MKCKKCKGSGSVVFEDDVSIPCIHCWGEGRIPLWLAYRDFQYRAIGVHIDMAIERLKYTRIGTRWWKRYGLERNAHRKAIGRTVFECEAMHGESLNRLRKWADFIENKGYDVGHCYRVETRIAAEAARAVEIAKERRSRHH